MSVCERDKSSLSLSVIEATCSVLCFLPSSIFISLSLLSVYCSSIRPHVFRHSIFSGVSVWTLNVSLNSSFLWVNTSECLTSMCVWFKWLTASSLAEPTLWLIFHWMHFFFCVFCPATKLGAAESYIRNLWRFCRGEEFEWGRDKTKGFLFCRFYAKVIHLGYKMNLSL